MENAEKEKAEAIEAILDSKQITSRREEAGYAYVCVPSMGRKIHTMLVKSAKETGSPKETEKKEEKAWKKLEKRNTTPTPTPTPNQTLVADDGREDPKYYPCFLEGLGGALCLCVVLV